MPTHSNLTEDEARARALLAAADARNSRDSDLFGITLAVGELLARISNSGDEYWEVTLVDREGVPRLCAHIRGGFQGGTTVRRCDPEGAEPPNHPDSEDGETPPTV